MMSASEALRLRRRFRPVVFISTKEGHSGLPRRLILECHAFHGDDFAQHEPQFDCRFQSPNARAIQMSLAAVDPNASRRPSDSVIQAAAGSA